MFLRFFFLSLWKTNPESLLPTLNPSFSPHNTHRGKPVWQLCGCPLSLGSQSLLVNQSITCLLTPPYYPAFSISLPANCRYHFQRRKSQTASQKNYYPKESLTRPTAFPVNESKLLFPSPFLDQLTLPRKHSPLSGSLQSFPTLYAVATGHSGKPLSYRSVLSPSVLAENLRACHLLIIYEGQQL